MYICLLKTKRDAHTLNDTLSTNTIKYKIKKIQSEVGRMQSRRDGC